MRKQIVAGALTAAVAGAAFYLGGSSVRAAEEPAQASAKVGQAAPEISLKDIYGKEFKLSEFKGKIVVLEWINQQCPVSKGKHQDETMQETYKKYAVYVVLLVI
jgi:cytochrome oxidase Cu insertion factor (SCO1/SenC/PrrC family)